MHGGILILDSILQSFNFDSRYGYPADNVKHIKSFCICSK